MDTDQERYIAVVLLKELERQCEKASSGAPCMYGDSDDLSSIGVDGAIDLVALARAALTAIGISHKRTQL